jgi:adenine-specific DNA-methyltransferase
VRDEVSTQKLRGGFYSPVELVRTCVERIEALLPGANALEVLEPAAGDGGFIRGLAATEPAGRIRAITAIELLDTEAAKARESLAVANIPGSIVEGDFVDWSLRTTTRYDAALGNPPFVRFQFVSDEVREATRRLGEQLGLVFGGVSNLWLPVLLGALSLLREGGAFAFIVPAESFTGVSAGVARKWLIRNAEQLRVDLFPPGSFPGVLQEVIVLSGVRRTGNSGAATLDIYEYGTDGGRTKWRHRVAPNSAPWTRFLLRPRLLAGLEAAAELPSVTQLGLIARFEVAAVTGANDFFSVDRSTARTFGLAPWTRPLLPRIRHAPGLSYTADDHEAATLAGARTSILDFADVRPDPLVGNGSADYVRLGEQRGLDSRYKTRIRVPWYRVPGIRPGRLMLSKRSHWYPRVVLNDVGAVTTDTIYRGELVPGAPINAESLVASFHNSLTLLTAEVEGRSFGGGVLELVPSEIARLTIPLLPSADQCLGRLDTVAREANRPDQLVDVSDELVLQHLPGCSPDLISDWREARLALQRRRLDRSIPGRTVALPVGNDTESNMRGASTRALA